jgi:hypothetical protein
MTTFDRREEGFENKFAHDEELKAAGDYAKAVVAADVEGGNAGLIRKVIGDGAAKDVAITEAQIRLKMAELMAQAVAQVKAGT